MKKYRLKPGFTHHHFVDGRGKDDPGKHVRLAAGDVVELTSAQAEAFFDRFESVDKKPEPEKKGDEKK